MEVIVEKNKKKIMCGGLAFSDSEDMEMLHQYALEGWIFKEMKGVHYILYKEEPQDLIFSYDIAKIGKEDYDDYVSIFLNAGWSKIKSKDNSIHFFFAPSGTKAVHTTKETRALEYKPFAKWSVVVMIISILFIICVLFFADFDKTMKIILVSISGGIAGASTMLSIGAYMRGKHKRLTMVNLTFKQSRVLCLIGVLMFLVGKIFIPELENMEAIAKVVSIIGLMMGISGGMWMLMNYQVYKDKKEIKKREDII